MAGLRRLLAALAACALPVLVAPAALAGDAAKRTAPPAAGLSLELNALQPSDKGCRLTFVIANHLSGDIAKAAFEIALFDRTGVVDRLTVLDFRELPRGKTKVSRFDLPGADCSKISRVLVNSATECSGSGIEPSDCLTKLQTATRAEVEFGS
ncbi:MAG: hypothetical protein L0I29_19315 [Hyphomicrobiales bacterium]|nr:hypothetical protein [Hyphomicrobiales bacterium]